MRHSRHRVPAKKRHLLSNPAKMIELSDDLEAFMEERVRAG